MVVDFGDEPDENSEDEAAVEQAAEDAEDIPEDDGKIAHDDAVVKTLRDLAIQEMRQEGVVMSDAENRMALKLFPAVQLLFHII